jgi:transcriptional regulator with XRE-family HTH domain
MNRLNSLRTEKNIKQDELAKILNADINTISRYERGLLKQFNIELENRICDYFNCSLDYLRGRSNIRNEAQYSETLKKVANMIIGFYSNDTKNKQDLTDEELAQFEGFILQFKELFQKLSNSRNYLQR